VDAEHEENQHRNEQRDGDPLHVAQPRQFQTGERIFAGRMRWCAQEICSPGNPSDWGPFQRCVSTAGHNKGDTLSSNRRKPDCPAPQSVELVDKRVFRTLRICHFYATLNAMKTTIDAAGRIVVPKSLRQALGLKAGQPVEIRAGDGRLEIEIVPTPMRLKKRGKGVVAVPDARLPVLTAEQVRDALERVRR
jgi:AbrB family looped-hinge helix DNA binding protein